MSLPPVDQGRDNGMYSPPLSTPPSMASSSNVDMNNVDLLPVQSASFLLQEVMPIMEQDIYAKHTKTVNQTMHSSEGRMDVTAPSDDKSSVTDDAIILPGGNDILELPAIARHQLDSVPGAYALMPIGGNFARSDSENEEDSDRDGSDVEAAENNQEGLAVANLVEDHRLAVALPNSEESIRHRERKSKLYKTFILLSVIFLSAIGAILLAFLVPPPAADQGEAEGSTNATYPHSRDPNSVKEYVLSLLPELTANAILSDSNSLQSRAFNWLLDDKLVFNMPDEQIKQRFALAMLYFSTKGDDWTNNTNWLSHAVSECDWYTQGEFSRELWFTGLAPGFTSGVSRTAKACDKHGLYRNLWLDYNNVVGSLPEEFYMLTHLQTVSMTFNEVQGEISTRIGLLTEMEGWGFWINRMVGSIPTQIGLLTNLTFFSSDHNKHTGTLPTELWHLSKLEVVSLSSNLQLKGTFPTEIKAFRNLRWLSMDETGLTGEWLDFL